MSKLYTATIFYGFHVPVEYVEDADLWPDASPLRWGEYAGTWTQAASGFLYVSDSIQVVEPGEWSVGADTPLMHEQHAHTIRAAFIRAGMDVGDVGWHVACSIG